MNEVVARNSLIRPSATFSLAREKDESSPRTGEGGAMRRVRLSMHQATRRCVSLCYHDRKVFREEI